MLLALQVHVFGGTLTDHRRKIQFAPGKQCAQAEPVGETAAPQAPTLVKHDAIPTAKWRRSFHRANVTLRSCCARCRKHHYINRDLLTFGCVGTQRTSSGTGPTFCFRHRSYFQIVWLSPVLRTRRVQGGGSPLFSREQHALEKIVAPFLREQHRQ